MKNDVIPMIMLIVSTFLCVFSTDISSADQTDKKCLEKNEIDDNAQRYVFIDFDNKL